MKICNTVPYFLENYEPTEFFLKNYFEKFDPHFKEYFLYHCKNPEKKIPQAIQKYPSKMSDIKDSSEKIEKLIQQVTATYQEKYKVQFDKDVHVIVGAYGSNAFTHRQIIPEVTFCLERLSSRDEHLKVIIAHEFGHALHNILSDREGMDWSKVEWSHPYTTLLQEGCATYFSKQVTDVDEAVYFSYNDSGVDWLEFAKTNQATIIRTFMEDMKEHRPVDIFHEWFSINGGANFGYTRLGYFIGYSLVQRLIEKTTELAAITIWKKDQFKVEIEKVLKELIHA